MYHPTTQKGVTSYRVRCSLAHDPLDVQFDADEQDQANPNPVLDLGQPYNNLLLTLLQVCCKPKVPGKGAGDRGRAWKACMHWGVMR